MNHLSGRLWSSAYDANINTVVDYEVKVVFGSCSRIGQSSAHSHLCYPCIIQYITRDAHRLLPTAPLHVVDHLCDLPYQKSIGNIVTCFLPLKMVACTYSRTVYIYYRYI